MRGADGEPKPSVRAKKTLKGTNAMEEKKMCRKKEWAHGPGGVKRKGINSTVPGD